MRFHDTHFHLDLMESPEEIVNKIENQEVYTIAVTNSPTVFFYTEKLAVGKKYVRAALGMHPELVAQRHKEIEQFIEFTSRTRYIGEIGLDNSNKTIADYRLQKEIFEKIILVCADARNKILTVHSRKAAEDVIDIIGNHFPGKVVLHWYSDSIKHLKRAINYGYYFSINYPMLHSKTGIEIIKNIPIEKLLIETDGPFTKKGNEVFTSLMAENILKELANLLSDPFKATEIEKKISDNFNRLLK